MNSISSELINIEKELRALEKFINQRKDLIRVHKENIFNRRFSAVSSAFSDFGSIGKRIEKEILDIEKIERMIQKRNLKEDKDIITDHGQELRRKNEDLIKSCKADFKSLYTFAKVFADDYVQLVRLIFDWRNLGDRSITKFYNSLEKYNGKDKLVNLFKDNCFGVFKSFDVFITQYRDDYVIHNQKKHKNQQWFLVDMKGGVRFVPSNSSNEKPSILPNELVYVVANLIKTTINFIFDNIERETSLFQKG